MAVDWPRRDEEPPADHEMLQLAGGPFAKEAADEPALEFGSRNILDVAPDAFKVQGAKGVYRVLLFISWVLYILFHYTDSDCRVFMVKSGISIFANVYKLVVGAVVI